MKPNETLALDAALGWGVNTSTTFGGTAPLKIWESKKRAKIGAIYDNFRVWAQISLEPMKIATICKWRWRERSFRHWTKKNCRIPSTTNKVISAPGSGRTHVGLCPKFLVFFCLMFFIEKKRALKIPRSWIEIKWSSLLHLIHCFAQAGFCNSL